jgi:hypothetical protein
MGRRHTYREGIEARVEEMRLPSKLKIWNWSSTQSRAKENDGGHAFQISRWSTRPTAMSGWGDGGPSLYTAGTSVSTKQLSALTMLPWALLESATLLNELKSASSCWFKSQPRMINLLNKLGIPPMAKFQSVNMSSGRPPNSFNRAAPIDLRSIDWDWPHDVLFPLILIKKYVSQVSSAENENWLVSWDQSTHVYRFQIHHSLMVERWLFIL